MSSEKENFYKGICLSCTMVLILSIVFGGGFTFVGIGGSGTSSTTVAEASEQVEAALPMSRSGYSAENISFTDSGKNLTVFRNADGKAVLSCDTGSFISWSPSRNQALMQTRNGRGFFIVDLRTTSNGKTAHIFRRVALSACSAEFSSDGKEVSVTSRDGDTRSFAVVTLPNATETLAMADTE